MSICPQCGKESTPAASYCLFCGFDFKTGQQKSEDHNGSPGLNTNLLPADTVIGDRFKIRKEIGRGNRGIIYEAEDLVLEEKIALKVLYPHLLDDQKLVTKLKREIKQARKIKHPNVCNIFDFGMVGNIFFISMELVQGIVLARHLVNNDLPDDQKTNILIGLVRALDAAHAERILHRDLNPANIMIDPHYRPVVMNFGIARFLGQSDIIRTRHDPPSAGFTCSPFYMAPEQFYSGKVDQRTDLYCFGIIAYELFTRSLPYTDSTPLGLAVKHMQQIPQPPRTLDPNIPVTIEQIILKCIQKNQDDRYNDAREILLALTGEAETDEEDRPRILVADDHDNIRDLIGTILEDNGCLPIYAKDGEEAIARVMQAKPVLIFMDLMMPVLDGYQASEFLRSNASTANIPIIMITSRIDDEYKAYSKSIGIHDHLTKPIDQELLVSKLNKYLGRTS
ncbi:protein kinase [bacterium]|nr:protein kinase [bacterium]